ncbi:hypothetical protein [Acrocarpospora sp. B8E8]|uniref:hypothetical protein n=1 Tax=Acrocarpospora sp. B8E8 TaxID=3153572 RepID=UPI00325D4E86
MDSGTVVAISATVIATASLAVSIYQLRLARLHNRHTLRPLLQIKVKLVEGHPAGFVLVNSGLGPAIVTGTKTWLDGEMIGPWHRMTARKARYPITPRPVASTLVDGSVIPSGETDYLLRMDAFDRDRHVQFRKLIEQRLDLEIRYESLYGGEDFIVTTRSEGWRSAALLTGEVSDQDEANLRTSPPAISP